jgi:uncharacterized membrane-anchored protein
MIRSLRTPYLLLVALLLSCALPVRAAQEPQPTPEQQAFIDAVNKLDWVTGPTTVDVPGKSRLAVPEGYVFLDRRNTDKYLELNHNPPGGSEVMVAPANLHWVAYLSFNEGGYVKDDDKINAPELLETLQQATRAGNAERRRRGWSELQVVGWALEPAYNPDNKRLEWATTYESDGESGVNFSTKVLSRRGHTSVVLVCDPGELAAARKEFDAVLAGYSFKEGERYADWVPGDKVATYGLAALVLGGAAAVAAKKGLFAALIAFLAAKIKLVIAGVVALGAAIKKFLFGKKTDDAG